MSQTVEPPAMSDADKLALAERKLTLLLPVMRYYADQETHQPEYDGDSPIPDSSSVFWDAGKRARWALKLVEEVR